MTLSADEIAQKQRHLDLLTRIRNNRHQSRAELAELEQLGLVRVELEPRPALVWPRQLELALA